MWAATLMVLKYMNLEVKHYRMYKSQTYIHLLLKIKIKGKKKLAQ